MADERDAVYESLKTLTEGKQTAEQLNRELAEMPKLIVEWVNEPVGKCLEEDRAFLINTAYPKASALLTRVKGEKL